MYSHKGLKGLAATGMGGVLLLTGCAAEEGGEDLKEVEIALIGWEEDIAVTYLWEAILQEKGYDVTVTETELTPAFQGVADGEIDLYLDMWLPATHHEYMDEHRGRIETLGSWYDNASLTLTVPEYMEDVTSIDDLPRHSDDLDGTIVGIEPDAGLTQVTQDQAMPGYLLEEDFELETSSGASMMADLGEAYEAREPIVVTLWRPHPAYAQYGLKDLEDPQGLMGAAETIHSIGRDGFADDYPELAEWIQNWTMNDDELAALEVLTVAPDVEDPAAGAREWLSENPMFLERTLSEAARGLEF